MNSPDNEQQLGLITGMRFPVQRTKVGSDGGDGDAEMQGAFIRGHPSDQQFCYRILGGFDSSMNALPVRKGSGMIMQAAPGMLGDGMTRIGFACRPAV